MSTSSRQKEPGPEVSPDLARGVLLGVIVVGVLALVFALSLGVVYLVTRFV